MTDREPAPAADRSEERPRPLSMRDLLAACAAADAVSTPPKAPPAADAARGRRGNGDERAEERDAA
ncbi:hypothetical protein [Streptomyces sp. NPDC053048]|uniref:hypothetical protein n=1 Tax=Streptomyces sp. NPDC053048 TaxID=3365694 RepID=UPI0037D423DA